MKNHEKQTTIQLVIYCIYCVYRILSNMGAPCIYIYKIHIHIILDQRIESLCRMATTLLGNLLLETWERFQYGLTILKPIIMSKIHISARHTHTHTPTEGSEIPTLRQNI